MITVDIATLVISYKLAGWITSWVLVNVSVAVMVFKMACRGGKDILKVKSY